MSSDTDTQGSPPATRTCRSNLGIFYQLIDTSLAVMTDGNTISRKSETKIDNKSTSSPKPKTELSIVDSVSTNAKTLSQQDIGCNNFSFLCSELHF